MGIKTGTPIAFVSPPTFLSEDLLVSKALMTGSVRRHAGPLNPWRTMSSTASHCVVTVQEEIGLRGAMVSAFHVNRIWLSPLTPSHREIRLR